MATINMQTMRYINLFSKITRVKTKWCFSYNNNVVFVVPSGMMSQAIGPQGQNIRHIQETLGKRIKVVREAESPSEIARFIQDLIEPYNFKSLEIKDNEIIITAGGSSKAGLIGRDRRRLLELTRITEDSFGKGLKIL